MSKINIQGLDDIDDPFYRYKMVPINVVHQKNKTIIDNIPQVCADLETDPQRVIKFFKKKFSISMQYKKDVLSTAARLTYNDFSGALREYIELFVLCRKCKLPERDEQNICKACGINNK